MDPEHFGMVLSWTLGLGVFALGLVLLGLGGPKLFRGIYLILTHMPTVVLALTFIFWGLGIMTMPAYTPWWPSPVTLASLPEMVYTGLCTLWKSVLGTLGL